MSTFSLAEPVHLCLGNREFDFPAGSVTAKDPGEEEALNHLLDVAIRDETGGEVSHAPAATVVTRSAPPEPAVAAPAPTSTVMPPASSPPPSGSSSGSASSTATASSSSPEEED